MNSNSNPPASSEPNRRPRYAPADHRARSHDAAHAELEQAQSAPRLSHPLVYRGDAPLIEEQDDLLALIAQLRAAGSFAYDSEFIGELSYFPRLCVIQVASTKQVALVDPMAELDLTPFWQLLSDPAVEKIVHAGQQDIEPVIRHLGVRPANVFDTQIAAGFAAIAYPVALSKLVLELTRAKLGKGLTFSHWDQRPLSPIQLRYAADDVRYLPLLRHELGKRLEATGHAAWAAEECDALCEPSVYQFDPQTAFQRVRGSNGLPPRNQAVLRELAIWRDAAARQNDQPPRSLLRDEVLLALARDPVRSVDKLERVRGLPRPVEAEYGAALVAATQRAYELPVQALPAGVDFEPTPTQRFRGEAIWSAAQCLCAGQGVDPALAMSRHDIVEFDHHLRAGKPLEELALFRGWRRAAVGQPLLEMIQKSRSFAMTWNDDRLSVKPA